jgi:hypothetical protein
VEIVDAHHVRFHLHEPWPDFMPFYGTPIWELGCLCVSGPRVAVSGLGLIAVFIYSAPYEEVRLKS